MKHSKKVHSNTIPNLLLLVLCAFFALSCSSDSDEDESSSYSNSSQYAVTGGIDVVTYCSAHIQASYSFPADTDIPDNYNWAKDWSLGICYGKDKNISNASADKCYIYNNGTSQDNWYGGGYAYVNDTTYFSVVLDYLEANTTYYYCTFLTIYGKTYYGQIKSFTTQSLTKSVDLGLSVKWATCNVGASTPEEVGGYYAWGETETKSEYSSSNYKYGNTDIGSEISGTKYDVAHSKLGGSYRMPTKTEVEELVNSCTWKYTLCNGVKGACVIGNNGNSVFLPYTGCMNGTSIYYDTSFGNYWTGSIGKEYTYSSSDPWDLSFWGGSWYSTTSSSISTNGFRYFGQCVRPVCD